MKLIKAQAVGNDFLVVDAAAVAGVSDLPGLARRACDRHRGLGADGLLVVEPTGAGAKMVLFNQDGGRAEMSGNGLRCVALWLVRHRRLETGATVAIETDAGVKTITLIDSDGHRRSRPSRFRAAMGRPEGLREMVIDVAGIQVRAIVLRVGNPQCVVLGPLSRERLHSIGGGLATHPAFPEGTNVELAMVETPERVRILIWERGVGPTEASGTGACAAAVAAAAYGGANRTVEVISPGGVQRVEWIDDELFLTGPAELVADIDWLT